MFRSTRSIATVTSKRTILLFLVVLLIGMTQPCPAATLSDNFDDGNAHGWISGSPCSTPSWCGLGNWRVEDGHVTQDLGGDSYMFLLDNYPMSTQSIQAKMLWHDNGEAGLAIWRQNDDNWVTVQYGAWNLFYVSEKWCDVSPCPRDENWFLTVYPLSWAGRKWQTLKLDANSLTGEIAVYLDGEYLFTHTVGANIRRTGLSGFVSSNAGGDFDDFSVTSDDLPPAIDIKVGPSKNIINPKSKGTVSVALLASDNFSPFDQLDTTTLTFGATGDESSLSSCSGKPRDVNKDGLMDLVCDFSVDETGFQCGDTEGVLKGSMLTGISFEQRQQVLITPCK